ncbi:hypothetical protein ILUMI_14472 [Ignelater luminosus]|uniref:Uncharacterized protein n=1 Tax=Ignelater luminosus TaxID=2038154 RepID=A0A8K0CUU7_IGNLU|nr:hypothetical protein ILUMI_14472 [Ignelater luminosus]
MIQQLCLEKEIRNVGEKPENYKHNIIKKARIDGSANVNYCGRDVHAKRTGENYLEAVCNTWEELEIKIKAPHLSANAKRTAEGELQVQKRRSRKLYISIRQTETDCRNNTEIGGITFAKCRIYLCSTYQCRISFIYTNYGFIVSVFTIYLSVPRNDKISFTSSLFSEFEYSTDKKPGLVIALPYTASFVAHTFNLKQKRAQSISIKAIKQAYNQKRIPINHNKINHLQKVDISKKMKNQ